MILHTILPRELIFQELDQSYVKKKLYVYDGIPILGTLTEDHQLYISQIISTNPNDYLHPECHPGSTIDLFASKLFKK